MKKFEEPIVNLEAIEVEDIISTSSEEDFVCPEYDPCDWET